MSNRKPRRPSNLHLLDGEQRQALGKFQKDFQTAMPHMAQLAQAAKRLHQSMIDAPLWRVIDTPKPDDAPEPEVWSVGHAQVNYVDHIKHEGTQDK
jgi:hypothetical protein